MEGKYIITTDNWFYAPDGRCYRAVWGNVTILEDSVLGVKTNRNSSNWYAFVGSQDKGVLVAGCQIHYAVKSENPPPKENVPDYSTDAGETKYFERPSHVYIGE